MTVIAAYRTKEGVWLGGDGAVFDEDSVAGSEPKVWRSGDWLIGFAGGLRAAEFARSLNIVEPHKFRDGLMALCQETNTANDTQFLCASAAGLFIVGEDFSVQRVRERYTAIGSGGLAALAALQALTAPPQIGLNGRQIVLRALKAAAAHTNKARPPFTVVGL